VFAIAINKAQVQTFKHAATPPHNIVFTEY
jgi:hypothetical protein